MIKYLCDICKKEFTNGIKNSVSYDFAVGILNFSVYHHHSDKEGLKDICINCINEEMKKF